MSEAVITITLFILAIVLGGGIAIVLWRAIKAEGDQDPEN